jgi:hypothetical protein
MKKVHVYRNVLLILISCSVSIFSCKKKKIPKPIADFNITSVIVKEGEKVQLTNKSQNSTSYKWTISNGTWTSTEANPLAIFEDAGMANLVLEAKNKNGDISLKSVNITIQADTLWRLCANNKKVWYLSSIVYGGSELVTNVCQKDDEFTLWKLSAVDTFSLTQAKDTCAPGTYLFDMPESGQWRYVASKKSLQFALYAFSSPINFDLVTEKCTKDEFWGYDKLNDVYVKLKKK